ncbi:hypothetical protein HC248_03063 [Polaromonas vacuolata]|uniref:Lysozyme inhibitor LprI N-terminal domain-containing protein n=1 Tax=Polaromonas vacuolata TaxID=37448 RepID=A0A6H2HD68_9BURK|nr:hypothetical protein [Polaromonas vacuolata]QJC57733.1 hypothetical protein HC248_03063 [Polaromonas vacuolata]
MKNKILILAFSLSSALMGSAIAMTQAEYKLQQEQISASYRTNVSKCNLMAGNTKDVCMSELNGADKIARAALLTKQEPGTEHDQALRTTRNDAAFETAKKMCNDFAGNVKDVCIEDANAAHVSAEQDNKLASVAAGSGANKTEKLKTAQKDALKEKREAAYLAVKVRCDSLAGEAKDSCVKDAKTEYDMK